MLNNIFNKIEIIDAGSEGKAVARVGDMVIFVPFVVPGDVVDIRVTKQKRSYLEGRAVKFHSYSDKRQDAFCEHFGTCGGCRWQNMKYGEQLFYKQKQVEDSLVRIGKIPHPELLPILPSEKTTYYRNKLEFTFSNHRWLDEKDMHTDRTDKDTNALGYHIPGLFDKVLDIRECFLQADPSNAIRLEAKKYAVEHGLSFYDVRKWEGFLRGMIIRIAGPDQLMVIFIFRDDEKEKISDLLSHIAHRTSHITSLYYVINPKKNDSLTGLEYCLFRGEPYITEKMKAFGTDRALRFRIGPASFFQTNSAQAYRLYTVAAEFAGLTGAETVYDLYTGTGTIACFVASRAKKVIGIESVAEAIDDARANTTANAIDNAEFHSGEAEKLLTPEFIREHGAPDVVITDPPRAGMHEKVVRTLLDVLPQRIVYVSCNPATQARDIALLGQKYTHVRSQPVDMFPHTQHVENVALLVRS